MSNNSISTTLEFSVPKESEKIIIVKSMFACKLRKYFMLKHHIAELTVLGTIYPAKRFQIPTTAEVNMAPNCGLGDTATVIIPKKVEYIYEQ